jgi:RimJ/RimL family protein N-acetyltransferase
LEERPPPSPSPAPPGDATDAPFAGDPAWKVERTLRDGTTITIRPIMPEDREALRLGFQHASSETRYLRFLGVIGELSEAALTYLTCVDQRDHVALVATITSPDLKTEHGVGVARFIRMKDEPHVAEAAITVADEWQKRGVGSALAHEIERAAAAGGVRVIRAEVLEGNTAMRGILEGAGARRVDAGENAGTLSYDLVIESPRVTSRLADVLRGAAETMAISLRKLLPPDSR